MNSQTIDYLIQGAENINVQAFLHCIMYSESTDVDMDIHNTTFLGIGTGIDASGPGFSMFNGGSTGGFPITSGSPRPLPAGATGTSTTQGAKAFGAFQFLPNTWDGLGYYVGEGALAEFFNIPDVAPYNQVLAAVINIDNYGALSNIVNGNILAAIGQLKGQWISLPGGGSKGWNTSSNGGLCGFYNYYIKKGGSLNDKVPTGQTGQTQSDKALQAQCPNMNYTQAGGAAGGAAGEALTNQSLATNLAAIQNNVAMQEVGQTEATWGKRQTTKEQSDWIGLRQYLLYLATTFETESVVPFVELIPIFMMDNPTSGSQVQPGLATKMFGVNTPQPLLTQLQQNSAQQAAISNDPKGVIAAVQAQFKASIAKFNSLQLSTGGIDLVTTDPFQEMLNKSVANSTQSSYAAGVTRNLGYKLYGSLVLSPGIEGSDQISKAGGIGFDSFEIQQGAAVMQGMTTITIKILDVQGNKLLDPASPWSFILNSSQIEGDFYFRYGWQINVPKYDNKNSNKTSTAYKFWNHPGWNVFGSSTVQTNGTSEIEKLKQDIWSKAQKSGNGTTGVLTLTQSQNIDSISYPGYTITDKNATGIGQFTVDRSQLNISNYLIISMINPEITVNPTTGSITASLQFRLNTAQNSLLCPITKCEKVKGLLAKQPSLWTLKNIMIAFIQDNLAWLKTKQNAGYNTPGASLLQTMIDHPETWLFVKDFNGNNIYGQVADLPLVIKDKNFGEINSPSTDMDGNNSTLRAWLFDTLSRNGFTMISAGDPGILTTSNSSTFILLYDNPNYTGGPITALIDVDAIAGAYSGNGFIGANTISRIIMQDDVFSFRFRGSLIEELSVETSNNPSAQQNQNIQALADSYSSDPTSVTGTNAPNSEAAVKKAIDSLGTTDVGSVYHVTQAEKNRNLNIILTRMSSCTIKCIAHPWLKLGAPIYVKGTGVFDSKYIIIKLTHNLDVSNKFTTTIVCVRVLNDVDYANSQQQLASDQSFAQNNPGANKAMAITTSSASMQTVPVTNINPTPANAITPTPQNTYLTPSVNELPDYLLDSAGTYNPPQ